VVDGCHAPASTTLRTDAPRSRAWLLDLAAPGTGHDLCPRHASLLEPTGRWVLSDERARRRAGDVRSIETARTSATPVNPYAVHQPPALPASPTAVDRRDDERAAGPAETFTDERDVEEMLDARSPLLSRAFAKSRDT
jgi:hypothetical protein